MQSRNSFCADKHHNEVPCDCGPLESNKYPSCLQGLCIARAENTSSEILFEYMFSTQESNENLILYHDGVWQYKNTLLGGADKSKSMFKDGDSGKLTLESMSEVKDLIRNSEILAMRIIQKDERFCEGHLSFKVLLNGEQQSYIFPCVDEYANSTQHTLDTLQFIKKQVELSIEANNS